MNELLKASLYRGGVTASYHRWRNARTLTVVMFHRVLPVGDAQWAEADPVWSVSDQAFLDCLRFFERHYNVIGMKDLTRARGDAGELPERALLITFDDGWADTEWCALPILKQRGLPAIVFVVADAVGRDPKMLTLDQLRNLHSTGVVIGSHGLTHTPIPQAPDAMTELRSSRAALARMLDVGEEEIDTFSFPHGLYTPMVANRARECGYQWLFTSDKGLQSIQPGHFLPDLMGRLNMDGREICNSAGALKPERLASWLFARDLIPMESRR